MKIEIKRLDKKFRLSGGRELPVFAGLDLTIESGRLVVILGASGCGKSTLLSMIAGLTMPSCGEILADQKLIAGPSPSRYLLFQNPSLLPWLTVADNISFGCRVRGDRKDLSRRVMDLIELTGLEGFANAYPAELSVGMTQRVCLAQAILDSPQLLLLDEPFSALDSFRRTSLQREVVKIWQQKRFTTILVTHDLDEAITIGQRIIFLGDHPCKVKGTYDIDLSYPRDTTDPDSFKIRNKIIRELQKNYTGFIEEDTYSRSRSLLLKEGLLNGNNHQAELY